jgi:hypothetical protein
MSLVIDPEFEGLCPPLSDEELAQLEVNILADGCRDAIAVWEPEGAGGPQVITDGHNRYRLCTVHGIEYRVDVRPFESREEAINWIIDNQLGRRNMTPEQTSYLRGKRYNREKRQGERTDLVGADTSGHQAQKSDTTAAAIGRQYGVDEKTIRRDGEFAKAIDELEEKVRKDLRQVALKWKSREDKDRTTKGRVTRAGKAVKERRVEPMPFMWRADWKDHQVIEAIDLIAEAKMDQAEQTVLNALLNQPNIPAYDGLAIVRRLAMLDPAGRQRIYALHASADPRERSLALTLSAQKAPEPDPQVTLTRRMRESLGEARRQYRLWHKQYPDEPWNAEFTVIDATLEGLQRQIEDIGQRAAHAHQQRIARAQLEGPNP